MRTIPVLILFFIVVAKTAAQGCSDAGFCSIDSFSPQALKSDSCDRSSLKLDFIMGEADHSIKVWNASLEFSKRVTRHLDFDLRLSYLSLRLHRIEASGFSDAFIIANYKYARALKMTLGAKIPFTDGNRRHGASPLPMDLQVSTGTFDLVAGMSSSYRSLQFSLAIQQPVRQNRNMYLPIHQQGDSLGFYPSNGFLRKGDLMLRISNPFRLGRRVILTPGMLPVYHLGNDSYLDSAGIRQIIPGSAGLTLNSTLLVDFIFSKSHSLRLTLAAPLVSREARPDGLTRKYVAGAGYRLAFN